jgi:hypothetical protein
MRRGERMAKLFDIADKTFTRVKERNSVGVKLKS